MAVRRFRDLKVRYTQDNSKERLVVQRVYVNTSNGNARTPITPLLMARVLTDPWVVEPREKSYRYAESCFIVDAKESRFKSIIPYNPNDINLKEHLKEIKDYPENKNTTYYGESRILK